MGAGWTVVARGDHDVEEVSSPRAVLAVCPSCGSRVRLTERELVRNLKVLGVALLATERGGRVFQCPQCEALCAREGDDLPLGLSARVTDDARAEELTERVLRAEEESLTWSRRAEVADERGDAELAAEMREQAAKSARAAKVLRRELAAATGARPGHSAAEDTAQGLPAGDPQPREASPDEEQAELDPPAAQGPSLDDELEALRARVAERRKPSASAVGTPDAPTAADDDLADLKAKLGRPRPEAVDAPPPAPEPAEPAPGDAEGADDAADGDDELAAMKRRLRKKP
ncbi:MAG: hypothetical protein R3A48_05050 [Polyangiales bacterium]